MIQDEITLSKVLEEDRKTGQKCIVDSSGRTVSTIHEYWQWAYSSVLGNTECGHFAEYLVSVALGVADKTQIEWDKYDLKSPFGITVEVKSSGYLQIWSQNKLLEPSFSIKPTKACDYKTNQFKFCTWQIEEAWR